MPTYEYRCSECANQFEISQRIDEEPMTVCERCGGRLRKVFHPAGIVFKGSGFYATDSRSKSKSSKESGDSKTESKPEKKDALPAEKKSDTAKAKGSE
jgi:putative FmdB family regulatory protein